MWKIVDKTKTSFDSKLEHIAFTDDEAIVKAFRESRNYEITKVNLDMNAMNIEVYSRHTWYEVRVPNTQNKYVTFRLVAYFKDYESAHEYIGGQYGFRQIHKEIDLIVDRKYF